MCTKAGLNRTQGKGDGWRVNHDTFQKNLATVKMGNHESNASLFLKKNGRTIFKYGK